MASHAQPDASLPCARRSRARGDSLLGTAALFDVWLLVEGEARSAHALREALPPGYLERNLAALRRRQATGEGTAVRTLAMRPPARDRPSPPRLHVTVAVPGSRRLYRRPLRSLDELLALDVDAYRRGAEALEGERVAGPLFAVCTDGRVDPCCAREGMAVYRALAERAGARARRVSHLGGCRFAPNVVTLPDGVLYGRVAPADAGRLVRETGEGRLLGDLYRGRATLDAEANAAETFLRRALDAWTLDAFRLEARRPVETPAGATDFRFGAADGSGWRVRLRPAPGSEARLTCHAAAPGAPQGYELLELSSYGLQSVQVRGSAPPSRSGGTRSQR